MTDLSQAFIQFSIDYQVLRFGNFTLKSGRQSPYFFNAGLFNDGAALAQLGEFYADLIHQENIEFDFIFGPAYKGIPLGTSVAIALANKYNINKPFCFNRKEAKDHGEKGLLVGAPAKGRALIVDDVITAGTAIRQSKALLSEVGASIAGVIVALDRQERGQTERSTIEEIAQDWQIPVFALAKLADIVQHLENAEQADLLKLIQDYRTEYGVAT